MNLPDREVVNGIIIGHEAEIRNKAGEITFPIFNKTDTNTQTTIVASSLRQYMEHKFIVRAFTKVGLGTPSTSYFVSTLEGGK